MPVTCGCVAGDVAPAAMNAVAVTVALAGALDVSVTVKPATGAGAVKVTASGVDCPICTVMLAGTVIAGGAVTVTLAVAGAIPAALAVMVASPAPTPVTGTVAAVAFGAKLTVAGVVATLVLLEVRATTRPDAGAAPERFSVKFCVPLAAIVTVDGEKLNARPLVTCTTWVAVG
jgi:hypothetical protein